MDISASRSGEPTAAVGSIRLHSAYDPAGEADRFVEMAWSEAPPPESATVVLIGPGLGYIGRSILQKRPRMRILALHLDEATRSQRIPGSTKGPEDCWSPTDRVDAAEFLLLRLAETSLAGLSVLQWDASAKIWSDRARDVSRAVTEVVRRLAGNVSTVAAFGRLWLRNTLRNYLETDDVVVPTPVESPVLLAASGPSLEEALTPMARYRDRYVLWALPSSLAALGERGIVPDLVVATDPGIWSRLHGRYHPEGVPVAMPLSAVPPCAGAGPRYLLPQGTPGEQELLGEPAWPHLDVPARGTVAATAVEAWMRVGKGPLWIAGLDLCWFDLRAHVRPHGFDGWLGERGRRSRPATTVSWTRARIGAPNRLGGNHRTGPALKTYADWFRRSLPQNRVCRIGGSPVSIDGIANITAGSLATYSRHRRKPPKVVRAPLGLPQRREKLRLLVDSWQRKLEDADRLVATGDEAASLLTDPALSDLLYALDAGGVLDVQRSRAEDDRGEAARRLVHTARDRLARLGERHDG